MSQPRGSSGPWARAAGHCISPRGQLGSIRCLTVQLRELWTRPICGGASAPWACDPPPRGLQQANDVPGSSTPTARTQSDVRSFRLDVWRIIIALRAATSLGVGRAALQCGGVVSRASCVSLQCTSCRSRPGHSSTWCTYSSTYSSMLLPEYVPADPCAPHSTAGLRVARVEP